MKVLLFVTQTQFYMLSLIFGNFDDDVDNRQFSWWVNIFTSQCSTSPTSSILSGLFRLWLWLATLHRETEDSDRWLLSWMTSFPFTNWETGKLWNENLVVSQIWLFRSFSLLLILFFHKRPQTEVGKLLCRQFWLKLVPTIRRPLIAFSNSSTETKRNVNTIWFCFAHVSSYLSRGQHSYDIYRNLACILLILDGIWNQEEEKENLCFARQLLWRKKHPFVLRLITAFCEGFACPIIHIR